ncbi:hypothetical protein JCM9279_001116 [Rhodotorula babjevae]
MAQKTRDPYEEWKALMRKAGLNNKLEGTVWASCDDLPMKINPGTHGRGLADKVGAVLEYSKGYGFPHKAMYELPLEPEVIRYRFVTVCNLALSLSGDLHLTIGNLNEAIKKSRMDDWYRRMNNLSPTADVAEHKSAPGVAATATAAILSKLDTLQADNLAIRAELEREQEANLELDDKVAEHGLIISSTAKQVAESRETLYEFVSSSKKGKGAKGKPRLDPETPTRPSRRVRHGAAPTTRTCTPGSSLAEGAVAHRDQPTPSSSSSSVPLPLASALKPRPRRGAKDAVEVFRSTKDGATHTSAAQGGKIGDASSEDEAFLTADDDTQGVLARFAGCAIGEPARAPEPGPSSGRSSLRQRGAPSPSSTSSRLPDLANDIPRRRDRQREREPEPSSPSSSSSSTLSPPGSDARSRKTWRRRRRSSTVGNDKALRRHIRRHSQLEDPPAS